MIDFEELKRIFVMWFKFLVVIAGTYFITSLMWIERNSDTIRNDWKTYNEYRQLDSLKYSQQIDSLKEVIQGLKVN